MIPVISNLVYSGIFILWVIYSSLEGVKEAYLYHYKNMSRIVTGMNLHGLFTLQRSMVLFCIFLLCLNFLFCLSLMLCFSFFHDGFYYLERNRLDDTIYTRKFTDYSTTSTAKVELNFEKRVWLLTFGVIFFILVLIAPYL